MQTTAMEAKKLLADKKKNKKNSVSNKTNMSPGCCVKFRIEKHCLVKYFAF